MKVYDVDAAIREQRPVVRLRGELYPVADHSVAERIAMTREKMELQVSLAEREEAGEDVAKELMVLQGTAVQGMLEGVPDEVAQTLSEMEWEAVTTAWAAARNEKMVVLPTDEEEQGKNG